MTTNTSGATTDRGSPSLKYTNMSPMTYPGERLIVCRNERLAQERARKREALLQATEARSLPLPPRRSRGIELGRSASTRWPHFDRHHRDRVRQGRCGRSRPRWPVHRAHQRPATELDAEHTVRAYKGLSVVERAFRSLKTVDLKVRPIYHYAGARVRAHVFLCMLAYYVEWHMRQRLKPLLFDDEEPDVAEAARPSVVAPAEVSPCPRQSPTQTHRLGRACAQLPYFARRSGHGCQQPRRRSLG